MSRVLALCALLAFIGLFALLNWPAFTAVAPLSLGLTTVEAPLGLIMLALLFVVCVAFTTWALALQATALMDARRLTKDVQTQRELADKAEASRFTELRTHLDATLAELRRHVEQQGNSLAASLGELEDRLDGRSVVTVPARPLRADAA